MSYWSDWRLEGSLVEDFRRCYNREAVIRRKICFREKDQSGNFRGIERTCVEIVCGDNILELEDVLRAPDGLTEYALVRVYNSSTKNVVKEESRFPNYLSAERYCVEKM